jgi:hypothetical protein
MSSSVNKTTPLLIYQPLPLAQAALLSMASQQAIRVVFQKMTYDLPADDLPLGSAL